MANQKLDVSVEDIVGFVVEQLESIEADTFCDFTSCGVGSYLRERLTHLRRAVMDYALDTSGDLDVARPELLTMSELAELHSKSKRRSVDATEAPTYPLLPAVQGVGLGED